LQQTYPPGSTVIRMLHGDFTGGVVSSCMRARFLAVVVMVEF